METFRNNKDAQKWITFGIQQGIAHYPPHTYARTTTHALCEPTGNPSRLLQIAFDVSITVPPTCEAFSSSRRFPLVGSYSWRQDIPDLCKNPEWLFVRCFNSSALNPARSPIRQPTRRASTQGAPVNSCKYPQASATGVCSESYPICFIIAIGGKTTVNKPAPGRRCIFSCLRAGQSVARDSGHDFSY